MGDSEDEYDRKRRDKFRGERAEPAYRGAERITRPRDDWNERDSWPRPRPRDYRGGMRDRGYSPSMEPAAKRMRHDYYGDNYYNHYVPPYHQPAHRGYFFREPPSASTSHAEGAQQPPMMSFKAFLATQDDNISDSEAIEKYNDYKLEFQRQQLNEFFVAHKDDEWFRLKYHPEDSVKRKEEQMAALKKRVEVFIDLLNAGKIGAVSVDCSKTNELLKLLDTVVIKLEGGTDEDLAMLEKEYEEMEQKYREQKEKEEAEKFKDVKESEIAPKKEDQQQTNVANNQTEEKKAEEQNEETKQNGEEQEEGEEKTENESNNNKEDAEERKNSEKNEEPGEIENEEQDDNNKETPQEQDEDEEEDKNEPKKRKRSYSGTSNSSSSSSNSDESEEETDKKKKSSSPSNKNKEEEEDVENEDAKKKTEEDEDEIHSIKDDDEIKPEKPKSLHKTTSIFLRNLSPNITKEEIETICSRYEGFLRVALADPLPERRFLRRGWVTFKRDANIKEICWNLNNIRLKDCELGAIVNRDLSRRIRPVNGITAHKQVVRSDIRLSAKVALNLDNKVGLWVDEEESAKEKPKQTFGLISNNPILRNITDYLIEEASAEEEELLGLEPLTETPDSVSQVERDENLISVLDKIILYLRVVHSVDYYNHCEYPNEDEMPNRCGILHARGPPPTAKTDMTQFIGASVEAKMSQFLPEKVKGEEKDKNEAKLIALALKDVNAEIDKFVQANTRELAKDKWLCPLSGKKFKGPDFVRKHIFNKHAEKLDEVKKEVEFFNNYLKDVKRPMLADTPTSKREEAPVYNHPGYGGGYGGGGGGGYGRPPPYFNQGYQRSRGFQPRSRGGGSGPSDFRPVIHYRDLDAPREPEEFI